MARRLARLPVCTFYDAFACCMLIRQPHRLNATSRQEPHQTKTRAASPSLDAVPRRQSSAPLKTAAHSIFVSPPPPFQSAPQTNVVKAASSTSPPMSGFLPSPTPQANRSTEAVQRTVDGYFFERSIDYGRNHDRFVDLPTQRSMKVYRVLFTGVKEFYADIKRFLKIWHIARDSPNGLKALNRRELELYMQMPRDIAKVAPALIGSSLPMVGYVIFPLVFMYPRTFLTAHFWSLEQRVEFQQLKMRDRLNCNRAVFSCLKGRLKAVYKDVRSAQLNAIFAQLGRGSHPDAQALLAVKDVFAKPPYSLASLTGDHIRLLTRLHGLPGGWLKRRRLAEHGFILRHIDCAICREGGVHNMREEAMRFCCYMRGLNPANLSKDDMIDWLRSWLTVSRLIQGEHISLYLHLPLLLAYNHPNNWQLIYCCRSSNLGAASPPLKQKIKQ